MATSWDPDSGILHIVYVTSQNSKGYLCNIYTIALLRCPKLDELDLIKGNQNTVRVLEGTASKWERIAFGYTFMEIQFHKFGLTANTTNSEHVEKSLLSG
jgi:hypothetical protein